jgi:uncharacterized membrane protein
MAKESSAKKNTGMAVVAYLLFFVPLLTDAKNDPFVKFHVKQAIILLIGWLVSVIIGQVPVLGWTISFVMGVGILILLLMGIINALNGEEKPLPIIGQYAEKLNF